MVKWRRVAPTLIAATATQISCEAWQHIILPSTTSNRIIGPSTTVRASLFDYEAASDDDDDMTSPVVIAQKLQGLLTVAWEKVHWGNDPSSPIESLKAYPALLASLAMAARDKEKGAEARNELYNSGVSYRSEDMEGLSEALDFASWAYEESTAILRSNLENANFILLQHEPIPKPGYVGHYIAINPERKLAVIGLKGTSTFEDIITDSCGQAVTYDLGTSVGGGGRSDIRCHDGMLISARSLADEVQPFVEQLLLPLGYKILVVGHSLGAGTACLLGVILRSRISALGSRKSRRVLRGWLGGLGRGIKSIVGRAPSSRLSSRLDRDRFHVVAFATPPVLDYDSALSCASFTTSIVNNSDLVTRLSMANLEILMKFLRAVSNKMDEREMMDIGDMSASELEILMKFLRAVSNKMDEREMMDIGDTSASELIQKLSDGSNGSSVLDSIMTVDEANMELANVLESVELRDPDHLYVPGRVLIMYEEWDQGELDSSGPGREGDDDGAPRVHCIVSNGTNSVLRSIEMDERMISDHFLRTAYRNSVDALSTKNDT